MHPNRWEDRPVKTFRNRRPHRWAVDVVKNSGMPLDTCALYIVLLDLPERWELKQSWVVREGYAAEKRVRRMFNDMIKAGRMRMARRHGDDGKLIPGIYEIADEPVWLDQRLIRLYFGLVRLGKRLVGISLVDLLSGSGILFRCCINGKINC